MRKLLSIILIGLVVVHFCSLALAKDKDSIKKFYDKFRNKELVMRKTPQANKSLVVTVVTLKDGAYPGEEAFDVDEGIKKIWNSALTYLEKYFTETMDAENKDIDLNETVYMRLENYGENKWILRTGDLQSTVAGGWFIEVEVDDKGNLIKVDRYTGSE